MVWAFGQNFSRVGKAIVREGIAYPGTPLATCLMYLWTPCAVVIMHISPLKIAT